MHPTDFEACYASESRALQLWHALLTRMLGASLAAGRLAAEARAAEAEARVAEQAAEREAMASRIAELEKSVEDLSAPAPDPPAADEKPVCGCVIA